MFVRLKDSDIHITPPNLLYHKSLDYQREIIYDVHYNYTVLKFDVERALPVETGFGLYDAGVGASKALEDPDENKLVENESKITVGTVDATKTRYISGFVLDQYGSKFDGQLTWTYENKPTGVTVDVTSGNKAQSVKIDAVKDTEGSLVLKGKHDTLGEKTVTIEFSKAPAEFGGIKVDDQDEDITSTTSTPVKIVVPTGSNTVTAEMTATYLDQFDAAYTFDAATTVTWAITDADGNAVDGLTIASKESKVNEANATVTIKNSDALLELVPDTKEVKFSVTATIGI